MTTATTKKITIKIQKPLSPRGVSFNKPTIKEVTVKSLLEATNLFDTQQIDEIASLKVDDKLFFDKQDRERLYEFINLVQSLGYEETIKYIKETKPKSTIEMLNKSPLMRPMIDKWYIDTNILREKPKGVKGLGVCPFCGGEELSYSEKQIRSADEPMTAFFLCINCGKRWRK